MATLLWFDTMNVSLLAPLDFMDEVAIKCNLLGVLEGSA